MKYLSILFLYAIVFMSCSSDAPEEQPQYSETEIENDFSKCDNGAIPPAFANDTSGFVLEQNHETLKGSIEEEVTFANGVKLKLTQSGCYVLKQNYQFTLPKKAEEENPKFWLSLAMGQFELMANVDPGFLGIAQLIYDNGGQMNLGEPINAQMPLSETDIADCTLMVDKFEDGKQQLLVVNFDLVYPK